MIIEDIYTLAKTLVDGDEFDDEDEALVIANVADKKLRAERNWPFDMRTATTTGASFAEVTDLGKITAVRDENGYELKRTTFANRFDQSKDVWIDLANKRIEKVKDDGTITNYIIDYKTKPVDMDMDDQPVYDEAFHPILAYEMVLARLEADQTADFYAQHGAKLNALKGLMVDYYESYNNDN